MSQVYMACKVGSEEVFALDDNVFEISIAESFETFMPTLQLVVRDPGFKILEELGISPNDQITIRLGSSDDDAQEIVFDMYSMPEAMPGSLTAPKEAYILVNGIMVGWKGLLKEQKVRSFGEVSASSVIETIAAECGFKKAIESSSDKEHYLQPGWTNAQMIKDLSKRAINSKLDGGFTFAVDRGSSLLFKSYEGLIQSSVKHTFEFGLLGQSDRDDSLILKKRVLNYGLQASPRGLMIGGGYGCKVSGYDFVNKKFVREDLTLDSISYSSLSSKMFIESGEIESSRVQYSPDFDVAKVIACGKVVVSAINLFSLEIMTAGDPNVKLGDKISVTLPGRVGDDARSEILEYLSGNYIVGRIGHKYSAAAPAYTTKLVLMSDGINKKTKKNLVMK